MSLPPPPHSRLQGYPLNDEYTVYDGDTLYSASNPRGIRLNSIQAPEIGVVGGEAAKQALFNHLQGRSVAVERINPDIRGGRDVSNVNDASEYMTRTLNAVPSYYGSESPELKAKLDTARLRALTDFEAGKHSPIMDAYRNVPNNPDVALPELPRNPGSGSGRIVKDALNRGWNVLQGDLFGAGHALARAVDKVPGLEGKNANTLRIMEEGVKRNEEEAALNPAKYGSYKDVKGVGDVLPFMAEKAIESLPSMAPMAVGGLMGVGAKTVLGALSSGVAKKTAATIGATALGAVPHAGEIEQEQMKLKDPAPVWQVAGGALINSALDTFGVVKGLDQFLGASKAKGVLDVAKQLAQSLGVTSVTEGATEGLQQLTNIALRSMHDPDYNPLTNPKDRASAMQELAEAGIGGAAAGGLMGGLGRASGMVTESMKGDPNATNDIQTNPAGTAAANTLDNAAATNVPPAAGSDPAGWGISEEVGPNEQMAVGSTLGPVGMEPLVPEPVAQADASSVVAGEQPGAIPVPTADTSAPVPEIQNEAASAQPLAQAVGSVEGAPNRLIDQFAEIYGDKTSHPQGAVSSVIDDLLSTKDDIITDAFGKPDFTYTKQDPVELRDYFDHLDGLLRGIESSGKGYSAKSMQLARDLLYQHYKALNRYEDSGRYARLASKEPVNASNGIQTPEVQELAPVGAEAQQLDARAGDQQLEAAASTAPVVPTDSVQELAPDAADNGVGEEELAPDSLSVTSAPDATGNLGNVTERDGATDSELSAELVSSDVENIGDARTLLEEARGTDRTDTQAALEPYAQGPDGIRTAQESDAPRKDIVQYVRPDKRVTEDASQAVYAKEYVAKGQLEHVAKSLLDVTEKDTPLAITKLEDGRTIAVPEGVSPEDYMQSNRWVEVVPVEGGFTVQVHTASGFNDRAASGGATGLDAFNKLGPTTIKDYLDRTSADTRINADEGFINPWGGNNQIDAMRVTKFGAELDNNRFITGVEAVKDAFLRGVNEIYAAGGSLDLDKLPSNLVVFRDGEGKAYRWKDIRDLKSTARTNHTTTFDNLEQLETSTKSPIEQMQDLYNAIRGSDQTTQDVLQNVQAKLRSDLFKMMPHDAATAFLGDTAFDLSGKPITETQVTKKHNYRSPAQAVSEAKRALGDYMKALGIETGTGEGFENETQMTSRGVGISDKETSDAAVTNYYPSTATDATPSDTVSETAVLRSGDQFTDMYDAEGNAWRVPRENHVPGRGTDQTGYSNKVKNTRLSAAEEVSRKAAVKEIDSKIAELRLKANEHAQKAASAKSKQVQQQHQEAADDYRQQISVLEKQRAPVPRGDEIDSSVLGGMDNADMWNEGDYEDGGFAPTSEDSTAPVIKTDQPKSRINEESPDPTITQKRNITTEPRETVTDSKPMEHTDERVAGFLKDVMKALGLKTKFHVVSEKNIGNQIQAYKLELARLKANNLPGVVSPDIEAMKATIEALKAADGAQIIYNDAYSTAINRIPIIYVPGTAKGRSTAKVIRETAHEMGHLIKRVAVDQLIEKAKTSAEAKALVKSIFGDVDWSDANAALLADEQFAHMTEKWALSHAVPRTALEKFFAGIGKQLRVLYDKAKAMLSTPKDRQEFGSFEKFMEAMMQREGRESVLANSYVPSTFKKYSDFVNDLVTGEFAPQNKLGQPVHNYTTEEFFQALKRNAIRTEQWTVNKPVLGTVNKAVRFTGEVLGGTGQYVRAVGASMRSLGPVMRDVAMHWGVMAGDGAAVPKTMDRIMGMKDGRPVFKTVGFQTIPEEIRSIRADGVDDALVAVLDKLPSSDGKSFLSKTERKKAAAAYDKVATELLKYTTEQITKDQLSDSARAAVDYLDHLYQKFVDNPDYSFQLKRRDQYYPLAIDKEQWQLQREVIIKAIAKDFKGADSERRATQLWHDVATSGALDPSLEAHDIFASGVSAKHSRKLRVELQRELVDMGVYSKDIHTTLASYTHQMIKRVVEQSRFGGYEVGDDGKFKTTEDGKYIYHPMARLKHQLEVSSMLYGTGDAASGVSPRDFARVRDVYLPALRGTLGGNIDPNYNAIISWTQLGLNIAMLPLSVTSSFADLGGIGIMREVYKHPIQALSDMKKVARYFLDGQRREQLQRAAKVMGIVNGHAIDHVLSESMSMDHMNLAPKKINEKFFEFIQMKRWTNFSRILATDFAIDTLRDLVKNPNDSLRDELSLSTADLNAWMNSGGDLSAAEASPAIRHAIARWVDMAILRPEAALRPPVGSDRRFALFWHLKEYMYSFYYTTMRRVWEQTKHEEGLSRALPGIALGVFAFTLASAGYELRKLLAEELAPRALGITPNYRRPDFMGEDYMYEMMLRGGLLGPFTVLHDMYSADKHGSLAITGLMGPAFAKLVEAMDDGIAPTLVTTTPLLAQSGTLRAAAKDYLDM